MARRNTINDNDREQWVMNDEGLYDLWRKSGRGVTRWVRENRELIDENIRFVVDGKKPAHYRKYGG